MINVKTVRTAILCSTLANMPALAGTKSFSGTVLTVKKGDVKSGAEELVKVSERIDQVQYTSSPSSWIGGSITKAAPIKKPKPKLPSIDIDNIGGFEID